MLVTFAAPEPSHTGDANDRATSHTGRGGRRMGELTSTADGDTGGGAW
jgi:hypothetical protein